MVDRDDVTLPDVARSVARRWRVGAGVGVPVAVLVWLYAGSLPTTWSSTAVVGFSPQPGGNVGADTFSLVLPSYVAYATSPGVERDLARTFGISAQAVGDALDVVVPPTTGTLTVTVTSEDEALVPRLADAVAAQVVEHAATDAVLSAAVESEATVPRAPAGPARTLLYVTGLLAGLLLGVLAALLSERLVPRVSSNADRLADLPVVARIPRSRRLAFPEGFPDARVIEDGAFGMSFRALRDKLPVLTAQPSGMLIAVCSALEGDGRSSVAASLAHSFARVGAQVLLVDGCADRAALTTALAPDPETPGLEDVLEGRARLDQALVSTGVVGLTLLPATTTVPFSDVLARHSRRLHELLVSHTVRVGGGGGEWSAPTPQFDVVVVDTPPVLSSDEAGLLARAADGVLLVALDGRALGPVREAVDLLTALGSPPLGVVVNQARGRGPSLGGRA